MHMYMCVCEKVLYLATSPTHRAALMFFVALSQTLKKPRDVGIVHLPVLILPTLRGSPGQVDLGG